jgi:signal transduction histidine kinase
VFYPPDKQAEKHPEHELVLALRDGSYEEEGWRVRKDGSRFWANVVITAIRNEQGEHIGFAKVTRDTTERRRMLEEREQAAAALALVNAELERLNLELQQAADDQAQFLAVTAHELRTPIGVVSGSAQTLSKHWEELVPAERTELLESMSASSSRLRRLLADLLTASRLDARAVDLDLTSFDLRELLEASASAARGGTTGAQVEVNAPLGITLLADRDRLAQAVDNLIGNALVHGAGPVRVDAEVKGDEVEVVVTDAGAGVPQDLQSRLFERFSTSESVRGTGLGLYIVRELARVHGGDARYEPPSAARPAGAFVLVLPLRREAAPSAPA